MTAQRHPDRAPSSDLPAWRLAEWDGNKLLNASPDYALWSGRFDPPAIGAVVVTAGVRAHRATVTGYKVDEGWLMLVGYRTDEPAHVGDLAGIEIRSVEFDPAANHGACPDDGNLLSDDGVCGFCGNAPASVEA